MNAHIEIIPQLPAIHALTGCDTVSTYKGIGKITALKVAKTNEYPLLSVGEVGSDIESITEESTKFIAKCYGVENVRDISDARVRVWSRKAGKSIATSPKLASLPPTSASLQENVKRAHFQTAIWKRT